MSKPREFFVIAHNIRSLHNVGSVFRTSDAFGVNKIFLTGYTGRPDYYVHKDKIGKVALGAETWIPWEYVRFAGPLIKRLKSQGVFVIALEKVSGAVPLAAFRPKFPLALVLGEEVRGVSREILKLCDEIVQIPMLGKKESLNVSVAFGVAAYEISKRL